jgi:predicted nucleotidyltransferase
MASSAVRRWIIIQQETGTKRSHTRRQSLNSVKIFSVNVAAVRRGMDEYARNLLRSHPEVEEVIVFGSFEGDTYVPGSDLDVFIVLREASDSPRDRISRFLPNKSLGVAVDVFAYTRAEMVERRDSPLIAAVKKSRWRYRR